MELTQKKSEVEKHVAGSHLHKSKNLKGGTDGQWTVKKLRQQCAPFVQLTERKVNVKFAPSKLKNVKLELTLKT